VKRLNKLSILVLFAALIFASSSALSKPCFADVPQVRNVTVWRDGVNTMLNVTVYHNQEIASHRVDSFTVTFAAGGNPSQTFPQNDPHTLDSTTSTFNVTLNIGSVTDSPVATVQAHCNLHGNSSQNWTATVAEFPLTILTTLPLALASLLVVLLRKSKTANNK
jgi:hypothetical protein